MSTAITYDPTALHLEFQQGGAWIALQAASAITLSSTYDVSERGVLLVAADTLTMTFSSWVDEPFTPLALGSHIRLRYNQPGADLLYTGLVTDSSISYAADPQARRHGSAWRADRTVTTTSLAASRMTITKSWSRLPAEKVSARLGRWVDVVNLGTATDALMPAESRGSTSLMELIRGACDYLGRPVRLVDNGTSTEVHVVSASLALPSGYTNVDALDMYSRAYVQTHAGEREVSFDADDITLTVTADLVNDDVRVLFSAWRIPDALPIPFNDPARVTAFTMTFTPDGCNGSLEFSYDTPHKIRYRPPAPYVPGDKATTKGHGGSTTVPGGDGTTTTAGYVVAFTEITPPVGVPTVPAGSIGAPSNPNPIMCNALIASYTPTITVTITTPIVNDSACIRIQAPIAPDGESFQVQPLLDLLFGSNWVQIAGGWGQSSEQLETLDIAVILGTSHPGETWSKARLRDSASLDSATVLAEFDTPSTGSSGALVNWPDFNNVGPAIGVRVSQTGTFGEAGYVVHLRPEPGTVLGAGTSYEGAFLYQGYSAATGIGAFNDNELTTGRDVPFGAATHGETRADIWARFGGTDALLLAGPFPQEGSGGLDVPAGAYTFDLAPDTGSEDQSPLPVAATFSNGMFLVVPVSVPLALNSYWPLSLANRYTNTDYDSGRYGGGVASNSPFAYGTGQGDGILDPSGPGGAGVVTYETSAVPYKRGELLLSKDAPMPGEFQMYGVDEPPTLQRVVIMQSSATTYHVANLGTEAVQATIFVRYQPSNAGQHFSVQTIPAGSLGYVTVPSAEAMAIEGQTATIEGIYDSFAFYYDRPTYEPYGKLVTPIPFIPEFPGSAPDTGDYVLPVVLVDSEPADAIAFNLGPAPAVAAYEADVNGTDYTLTYDGADALSMIEVQGVHLIDTVTSHLVTGTTEAAHTVDVTAGDRLAVYASTLGATAPQITASDPTACPLTEVNTGTTDTTAYVLLAGTVVTAGSYDVSATGSTATTLATVIVTAS